MLTLVERDEKAVDRFVSTSNFPTAVTRLHGSDKLYVPNSPSTTTNDVAEEASVPLEGQLHDYQDTDPLQVVRRKG